MKLKPSLQDSVSRNPQRSKRDEELSSALRAERAIIKEEGQMLMEKAVREIQYFNSMLELQ